MAMTDTASADSLGTTAAGDAHAASSSTAPSIPAPRRARGPRGSGRPLCLTLVTQSVRRTLQSCPRAGRRGAARASAAARTRPSWVLASSDTRPRSLAG
ncbi:hypothetical protein ACFPRL_29345 [Pseudoclavibacter helvolus]